MRYNMRMGLGLMALVLLAACGQAGLTPERPKRPTVQATLAPPAGPGAPGAEGEGAALLQRMREAFEACSGAEAEGKAYSEGHFKAGAQVTELRRSTYRTKMIWVKPRKIRGEILETDNFLVGGAKMVTLDGKKVRVKGAGVLGLLPLTLDAGADLLSSNRRHKFNEQTPDAISERLLGTHARWTVAGRGTVAGTAVVYVEVVGVPRLDKEIERELVAVDPNAPALRGVTMWAKGKKVVEVTFTKFRWNPKANADAFEL